MKIIGLGHYSRTGKDSFANYLLEELASTQLRAGKKSFAWKLKQICFELYAWAGMREPEFYETPEGAPYRDIVLEAIGKTPVQIWVDAGTPAMREQVYDRTWIDYLLQTDHGVDVLVIPDVRFPNEVEAIRALGGTLIKVVRPGYGPRKTVADRALLGYTGWDYVIGSSGEMSELKHWSELFASAITNPEQFEVTQGADHKANALAVEVVEPWEPEHTPGSFKLHVDEALAGTLMNMHAVGEREGLETLPETLEQLIYLHFPSFRGRNFWREPYREPYREAA